MIKKSVILGYGIGLMALLNDEDIFNETNSLEEAIMAAAERGFSYVIEYTARGKRILTWKYEVKERQELEQRYLADGDKRAILNASADKCWLVLYGRNDAEIILPLSKVRAFEKIEVSVG